ncbi:hypothetical protein CDV36_010933 [Fusarium kuroshium]|uniref:Amino acid permease/ SLC12A domain-containing protein n=1 Tax=Fusarium kuroshium TaxID=2010991 RepID=A0A3M2RX18_9HYPO|nr:hypothetical protein CDV36_010933 [Fusarium kuroshium]
MMAMSLVGFIVFVVLELEAIRYGIGAAAMEEGFDINKAAMFFTIAQVVYIITTGISKMGVALVLFRLASGADMKVIRSILAATTVILGLWSSIATIIRLKFVIQVTNMSSDRGLANPDIVPITVEATL